MTLGPSDVDVRTCCAAAYASPTARWLLGESFHPGGAVLTSRLVRSLRVGPGATVVDIGSGPGTSAVQVASETGCRVIGIELSAASAVGAARAARESAAGRVHFMCGEAERLPLPDASVDGAISECVLCTIPDKEAAARELARVLRPRARLALSDLTAAPEDLPAELTTLEAWIACLAGARPLDGIAALLQAAGFVVETTERHDGALAQLLDRVEARLRGARFLRSSLPEEVRGGIGKGLSLVASARSALEAGLLGYGVVIARH